jgi:uncharacterized protein (TIGR02444 family)
MTPAQAEAESWAFALSLYAKPGVADACLALQNEAGVDVMLLLMVAFAAVKRRTLLTLDEITEMNEACLPWREQIVRKLRTIRTELKAGPRPAPSEPTEAFRSKVKALELDAEKFENQLLVECLPLRPPEQERVKPEQLQTVLHDVVLLFAGQRESKPNAALSSAMATIVAAAIEDAS